MFIRSFTAAVVISAALLVPCAACAQTVAEAVRLGLGASPTLQAEKARLLGVMEQQVQAQNLRRPSVQVEATTSLRQVAILQNGSYNLRRTEPGSVLISASQPLILGGRYEASLREADLRVGRSIARIRTQELTIIRQVIESYATVRKDYQVLAIRAEGVQSLARQLTGARLRQQEGLVGLTEVSQVETRIANARGAASVSQARLQSSWATLERLLGERPTGLTEDVLEPSGLPATLTEAIDLALLMNHDLKASRFNEDIARAVARSAEVENAPRMNLQASVSGASDIGFNGGRNYDAQIGARLVIPLWNGGQPQSRVRAALSESNAARFEAIGVERILTEQVTQAWANLEAARNATLIAQELVRAAEVARTGAGLEFEIGLRSIIEVLNQEQELQDAKVNSANTTANLMIAQATIFNLIGLDPTGTIDATTQFDPSRLPLSLSRQNLGRLAVWERPLVSLFDGVNQAQKATQPFVRSVRRTVFGPEQ